MQEFSKNWVFIGNHKMTNATGQRLKTSVVILSDISCCHKKLCLYDDMEKNSDVVIHRRPVVAFEIK